MLAGGEGRGEALLGIRGESDALVQGSRDGDDGGDGPVARLDPAGRSDAGECRGLAGRICRSCGDRGDSGDGARYGSASAGESGGSIVDCARRIREEYLPRGYFSVATFQEPGWRTEGKKTLGLEMAEPAGERLRERRWQLPDVIVYPTGGGTGVVGMAKAFDELEALGLVGPDRPRMVCVQSAASTPIVRAFEAGAPDIQPLPPGRTIATGLNVAQNVGHVNVLRIIRDSEGCALTVSEEAIAAAIRDEWRQRRFAWSPEGAATVAALPDLADRGLIRAGDRVVLVNTASAEKYLPTIREWLDGGL
jgi:threonine synthase